jgi:prepilin-type N-terminal cleavage/methylation domain-containing protein
MKLRKLRKGFTLIELLVVVAIIALLTLMVILALRNNINKANDAKRKADLQRIATAFEEYYSDKDCYPAGSILTTCGSSGLKDWGLSTVPCDPVFKTPYCYITDADKPTCFQKFRILNTLKYLSDPVIKLLGCGSGQYCGWETECGASGNKSGFNYGVSSLNITVRNPNITIPSSTPLPTLGGIWGCTPGGDCNNYGLNSPLCTHQFPNDSCGGGLYCGNPAYRCNTLP